jgi:signal transduction histidine kinase
MGDATGWLATVPAAVALAGAFLVLATWRGRPDRIPAVAAVAGAVSLATTAAVWTLGRRYSEGVTPESAFALVEMAALTVLVASVVRVALARRAAVGAGLAGLAVPCWLLRFGDPGPLPVAAFAAWLLPVVLAVAAGWYLRSLDGRRHRAVAAARRAQRLELARDLHDFVAHDVSEMLAQAQAGQVLADRDAAAAAGTLPVIEQAALRALASLDRTVAMLHDGPARASLHTLDDLRELADRFGAELDLDPDLEVPRELAATAYRVVVEALTNVRRHATGASRVEISVRRVGDALEVAVADDGRGTAPPSRRGGLGLPGLQERVRMLGGTLTAGPREPRGWRLAAVLPAASARPPKPPEPLGPPSVEHLGMSELGGA